MRKILSGTAAARGSALGRARVQLPHALDVEETRIAHEEVDAELQRIHDAVVTVREEMRLLRERLHGALAHEVGEFLDLHALLLDDPELLQGIDALIRTGRYSADYALRLQRDRIAAVFDGIDDPYLRSRIDDIDQVIGRLYAALNRRKADLQGVAGEILVTDNIGPADLAQLHAQGVIGVVTAASSALSHSAILARSLHMPLVVGASAVLQKVNDGDVLIIDGGTGLVVLEPNAADLHVANSASSIACVASPVARSMALTSSCGQMRNRARTWPKHMRWVRPASGCIARNTCSSIAAPCRTKTPSSVLIATWCWA
jgi:phosphotransferase system enzyme I (PtsI)